MSNSNNTTANQTTRWQLVIAGKAFLSAVLRDGRTLKITIDLRFIAPLLALVPPWLPVDAALTRDGWVTRDHIADSIRDNSDFFVSPGSVSDYLAHLNSALNQAARELELAEAPPLIERARGLGARLHPDATLDVSGSLPKSPKPVFSVR